MQEEKLVTFNLVWKSYENILLILPENPGGSASDRSETRLSVLTLITTSRPRVTSTEITKFKSGAVLQLWSWPRRLNISWLVQPRGSRGLRWWRGGWRASWGGGGPGPAGGRPGGGGAQWRRWWGRRWGSPARTGSWTSSDLTRARRVNRKQSINSPLLTYKSKSNVDCHQRKSDSQSVCYFTLTHIVSENWQGRIKVKLTLLIYDLSRLFPLYHPPNN